MTFMDTSYLLALLNQRDQWHTRAIQWKVNLASKGEPLITTEFVLLELLNALSSVAWRRAAWDTRGDLLRNPLVTVIGVEAGVHARGVQSYEGYRDKSWSLTGCTSFLV